MGADKVEEEPVFWDWPLQKDGNVRVFNTDQKFKVSLLVQFFSPKEIEVKVCGPDLVITCQQQRAESAINREIHRAYKLPTDIDLSTLSSSLSKGTLVITASKLPKTPS